ncbi:PREDICTED: probable beta-1,3-galactosyltransferase 14 [Tarenaya hassleriana]|uniref:probable beta-1,3-galactosyltransferase 14 n=1 Tax=Tarenaya hassleriana TaxID=28532 RepID=UPI00053C965D|nr:PREDICTED: probable beta-1,3-galactosyltransferase 14 [Tarenaya hassleriana]
MPSSPKLFHARPSLSTRRSTVLIVFTSLAIGIAGFLFGLAAILSPGLRFVGRNCLSNAPPATVRVVWDVSGNGNGNGAGGEVKRHKVMGFVGIQTGFGSAGRRRALRMTWMPSDPDGLRRLEESTGLAFRFIIGKTKDEHKMAELRKEIAEYDDFILLDIEEEYSKLPYKTLAFFKAAHALYDSEFYVKADDDIYLRPDRLSLLLAKDRTHTQTYLGCLKKGPVFTDPKLKWYEPLSNLLWKEYFLHAYGPIYALSADVVASLVALRNNSFRMFSNEDVTIGAWMLAMNVNHENHRTLCEPECSPTSVAVWDIPKCSGLCNPEKKMLELHKLESCSKSPTLPSDDE